MKGDVFVKKYLIGLLAAGLLGLGGLAILGQGCAKVADIEAVTATTTTSTTSTTIVASPANLDAVADTQQITLSWEAATGAASYNLYWSNTTGVTTASGTKIASVTSPYTHTGLTYGQTYYYVATAVNTQSAESLASNQAAGTPETIGVLDTSFDSDGIAMYEWGYGHDYGLFAAIDSLGRIVVAGYGNNGANDDIIVVRYNTDGSLDTSFDTDGFVSYNGLAGLAIDRAYAVAVDSSDRIVVAGYKNHVAGHKEVLVLRFNTDGTLDTSFDSDGVASYTAGLGYDQAEYVTLDSAGNILVSGQVDNGPNSDVLVLKYSTDGSLDTTFGNNGVVSYEGGFGDDAGRGIAFDSSGNIIVAGYCKQGTDEDILILKYSSDGVLDTTFGTNGVVTYDGGSNLDERGYSVMIDSSDRIIVAGYSAAGAYNDVLVLRYTSAGVLDTSFGANGVVVYDGTAGLADLAYNITQDALGRLLVTGYSNATDSNLLVLRYSADGDLDANFGTAGAVTYDGSYGVDRGCAIVTDSSNRIVVAGYLKNASNNYDLGVWRYR